MENINTEVSNAALMCARATFDGSELTVSVNGRAKSSLLETIFMFTEYFSDAYPDKKLHKLELFICEADMHAGQKAWQTSTFNS